MPLPSPSLYSEQGLDQVGEMRMIEAVRAAIAEEMERDERVLVMGEDVGKKGGVFGATDGLYERFGEARVLDTPLAESAIIGVAIGAALNGLIPIAEIQFADFIHPAFDQIVSEAARTRYRTNGDWSVPIVVRAPFGGGVHGGLYHSQSIEAFYAHVPASRSSCPAPRPTPTACSSLRSATRTRCSSSSTRRSTGWSRRRSLTAITWFPSDPL